MLRWILLIGWAVMARGYAADPDYPYWPDYHKATNEEIVPQAWTETDHTIEGWDWSLPTWVSPSPQGIIGMDRNIGLKTVPQFNSRFPVNPVFVQWVYWRELEAVEGTIDWQPLLDRIAQCEAYGQKIIIRILAHTQSRNGDFSRGHAPRWLEGKGISMASLGVPSTGVIWASYDPSDPIFHAYYTNLIHSLKLSGIPQMDTVKALYAGYASKSLGDEGIGPDGMDPSNEPQHVRERLDAWAAAAAGVEHKIFMGGPSEYGFAKGFGVRRGFVEKYLYTIPDQYIGQQVDADGYLYVDEDAFVIKSHAFNGEVNEEYNEYWATEESGYRFGTNTLSFSYRYFMSNLRLIQMRCTYVHNVVTLMPKLLSWVAQELGRTVEDTPDIWCYLNTSYLYNYPVLKNFERWLYQRDEIGYETTPVEPISNEPVGLWMTREDYDHMAKKGAQIGFAIDDRFIGIEPTRVAVKVSYLDQTAGALTLHYQNPDGAQQKSVAFSQDGALKTTTFIIDDLVAPAEGFDYDLVFSAPNEAVLSFVRVIKLSSLAYNAWSKRWGRADLSNLSADYDLDGLSNYGEYALGGNPTNAVDSGAIEVHLGEDQFTLVYASNRVADDVCYRLLDMTNLVSGTVHTNEWDSQTTGPLIDDYITVSNHYIIGAENPVFIRLQTAPK